MWLPNRILHICRFADRDMLMRYHWSLGIGHTYSHTEAHTQKNLTILEPNEDVADEADNNDSVEGKHCPNIETDCFDDPELGVGEEDDLNLDEGDSESDSQSLEGGHDEDVEDCDEEILELSESYYTNY